MSFSFTKYKRKADKVAPLIGCLACKKLEGSFQAMYGTTYYYMPSIPHWRGGRQEKQIFKVIVDYTVNLRQ